MNMEAENRKTTHVCRVCGVETLSSRACPKCGRRSFLSPIDAAEDTDRHGGRSAHTDRAGEADRVKESRKKLITLVTALTVVVAASITGIVFSLYSSQPDKSEKVRSSPAQPVERDNKSPRSLKKPRDVRMAPDPGKKKEITQGEKCGFGYCITVFTAGDIPPELARLIVRESSSGSPSVNGKGIGGKQEEFKGQGLIAEHCFLVEQTPTQGRWWYIPAVHRMFIQQPDGGKQKLFEITGDGVEIPEGADSIRLPGMAHGTSLKRGAGKGILGSRLFYLMSTPHGFSLASVPRLAGFLEGRMAMKTLTATSLMPLPIHFEGDKSGTVDDDRPVPHLMRPGEKMVLLRWTKMGDKDSVSFRLTAGSSEKSPGKKSDPPGDDEPEIRGTVELDESGMTKKTSLFFKLPKTRRSPPAEGMIRMESRKNICAPAPRP